MGCHCDAGGARSGNLEHSGWPRRPRAWSSVIARSRASETWQSRTPRLIPSGREPPHLAWRATHSGPPAGPQNEAQGSSGTEREWPQADEAISREASLCRRGDCLAPSGVAMTPHVEAALRRSCAPPIGVMARSREAETWQFRTPDWLTAAARPAAPLAPADALYSSLAADTDAGRSGGGTP